MKTKIEQASSEIGDLLEELKDLEGVEGLEYTRVRGFEYKIEVFFEAQPRSFGCRPTCNLDNLADSIEAVIEQSEACLKGLLDETIRLPAARTVSCGVSAELVRERNYLTFCILTLQPFLQSCFEE